MKVQYEVSLAEFRRTSYFDQWNRVKTKPIV